MVVNELIAISFVGIVDQVDRGVCQFILLRNLKLCEVVCINQLDNVSLLLKCESASDTWLVHLEGKYFWFL